MMEILGVSAGGSPLKNHTDFSQSALSETAKVGFLMVPDTHEHTETDAKSATQALEPTESSQSGAKSGEKEASGDLDSTGDSDRLVIADEETDTEQESESKPVPALQEEPEQKPKSGESAASEETRVEDVTPREVPATENVPETGIQTSHATGVSELSTEEQKQSPVGDETNKCGTVSNQADVAQTKDPQTEEPQNTTTATALLTDTEPELLRKKVEQISDKAATGTVSELEVENRAPVVDAQDVDAQSNASTDSGRDQAVTQMAEKKRRRRKPIKVSKHEPEKFDNNYNSVEVVPPAPKPVAGLMNSFVAKAMKLWYDEELPKTLTSPSKDLNKLTPDLKAELAKRMELEKKLVGMKEIHNGEQAKRDENVQVKSEHQEKEYRSGVAPDDQYYSTPSPATPESRPMGGVQDYWTPGRCYIPSNNTGGGDQSLTPDSMSVVGGTPLVAKAMQSLSSPSPAVSPSIGSDQESPVSGPKRYICSLCNKSFTFRTNLTRHQRAFHGRPCRRRTHDAGSKEESEAPRAHSVSSEEVDHMSDHRDFIEEKIMPKTEPHMDPRYGRFSPSIVSEAKAGRFSPSMPSPSASSSEPVAFPKSTTPTLQPHSTTHLPGQDFVVIPPREPVSCSLCLTTFDSQTELNRHEPTCRGIDRSKLQSDSFGAIDLTKPKACKQEPLESSDSERETHVTYKPKFHYNMADMMKPSITPTMETPLTPAPFIPNPAALQGMPLLPHHLAASGLLPHQLSSGLPLPFSPNGPGKRPYRCTLCTKKYSSFTSLAKHVGFVHKINLMAMQQQQHMEKESMAAMVAMANAEMKMLVEQEQGGSMLNLTGDSAGHFPCKICGQNFSFAANLRTHYHTVHLGMKEASSRDSASPDIMRAGTKLSEWVCDVCGQNFASKRNLNRHLSHVHKLDRKKEPQPQAQDGRSTTPIDKKPFVPVVPTYPLPTSAHPALNLVAPKDDHTPSVRHLQDVIDRVVSADASLKQEDKPVIVPPPIQAPPVRDHPVKLPPKKAIMEEYQKEAEMKLRLEREQQQRLMEMERHRASPASSEDSGVLNLSRTKTPELSDRPVMPAEKEMPQVIDSSVPAGLTKDYQPVDLSSDGKSKMPSDVGEHREYYPNPFSAILNLSQTYLRKLLNETPMPNPPPHYPDLYSTAPIKDKENSIENDRYGRNISHNRSNMQGGRDYSPDTASRLRDMLSSKGVGNGYHSEDSRSSSRNNSRPPSGRSTPVDSSYDRRPLVKSSEKQSDNMGLSEISPLRTNTANMMALKLKLMDQNSNMTPDWKPKNQKKRRNSDISSMEDLISKEKMLSEGHEPFAKKARESLQLSENADKGKVPNVESVRTGEFPAIAIGKRHICGLCGASFTFQTNLTRHQRKLHGKPFVRKSSVNQPKGSENLSGDEKVPLSMVSSPSPTPITLIQQE